MSKTRRPAMPADYLDTLLPAATRATRRQRGQRAQRVRSGHAPTTADPKKNDRATFHLPPELLDEAKNAVVALSGPPVRLTLALLVRTALARELERLRKAHHKGKPWPQRSESSLVGGRPVKG